MGLGSSARTLASAAALVDAVAAVVRKGHTAEALEGHNH